MLEERQLQAWLLNCQLAPFWKRHGGFGCSLAGWAFSVWSYRKMSHYLVEVPKEPPLKGCWILIAAKNWIYEDVLYTPDNSYSHAYKLSLLKDGKDPDIITWERSHSFKVIHQFGNKAFSYCLIIICLLIKFVLIRLIWRGQRKFATSWERLTNFHQVIWYWKRSSSKDRKKFEAAWGTFYNWAREWTRRGQFNSNQKVNGEEEKYTC